MTRHHGPHELLCTGKRGTGPLPQPRRTLRQNLHACIAGSFAKLARCARTAAGGDAGAHTGPGRRR